MYNTGLKHSETDVVEEVFGSTRTRRHKNLEKLLQGIDPQDNLAIAGSVDDFTEDFLKKLTRTGHWTGYLLGSL
jgi:hypothetical protein